MSCEDQARADERISDLVNTPAAIRWISAEPLLGPVNLTPWLTGGVRVRPGCRAAWLDWVVTGSESGPGARPCDLDWVRSIRDQCSTAGVPLFWKQHVVNGRKISLPELDGVRHDAMPEQGEPT